MKLLKIKNLLIFETNISHFLVWKKLLMDNLITPSDNIQFICKGSELTEEVASTLVDETIMWNKHKVKCYRYRSYREGFVAFPTALESFESLVNSKSFYWGENPLGGNPCEEFNDNCIKSCQGSCWLGVDQEEWEEAEAKTFNLNQTLIFKTT